MTTPIRIDGEDGGDVRDAGRGRRVLPAPCRCVAPQGDRSRPALSAAARRSALALARVALFRLLGTDRGDALRHRNLEPDVRPRLVVEVGQRDPRKRPADRPFDRAKIGFLLRRHERERVAGQLGASGAADAMDVVVGHGRHVEVDDVAERLDVDAPRRDIGGDEHAILSALEAAQRFHPLRLRAVAVNARGGELVMQQVIGKPVRAVLGPREDERFAQQPALAATGPAALT